MSDSLWPHGLQPFRFPCPWGFSRQEYWNGLLFSSPVDCPHPGIELMSSALAGGFFFFFLQYWSFRKARDWSIITQKVENKLSRSTAGHCWCVGSSLRIESIFKTALVFNLYLLSWIGLWPFTTTIWQPPEHFMLFLYPVCVNRK